MIYNGIKLKRFRFPHNGILRRSSIKTKLAVTILSAVLIVVSIGMFLEISWDLAHFREQAVRNTQTAVSVLSPDFIKIIVLDSPHVAAEVVKRLRSFPDLRNVTIFDNNGNLLFEYTAPGARRQAPGWEERGADDFYDDYLKIWRPVYFEGQVYGQVFLRASMASLRQELYSHLQVIVFVFPALVVVAVILAFVAQRYFTEPIMKLKEAVHRVTETQDYSVRVISDEQNEIGALYHGFNNMLEKIQQATRIVNSAKQSLKFTNRRLQYLASHDSLTGLLNRGEFERRLGSTLKQVQIYGRRAMLLYFDLDQFKVVNDTCGHVAGDELLRRMTQMLQQEIRNEDTMGRLGGDEFGVLLIDCAEKEGIDKANLLRKAVQDFRFVWEEKVFTLGVSIGIVPITPYFNDITALLSAADKACYAAKEGGRNRIHVYKENDAHIVRRQGEMQWVSRVRKALEEERLLLYVQEIVAAKADPADCVSCHYEVLLRMLDERGNVVTPQMFVPAAERYGLMTALDCCVVDNVFDWLASVPEFVSRLNMLSINLSGCSVGDDGFLRFLKGRLARSHVSPEKLCFEITETAAITNIAKAMLFMKEMKDKGCKFALDDFGSGVSSFGYLKKLPVDFLKIDGVFVRGMLEDPIDRVMVKTINEIGHAMNLKTVAEFVETDEVRKALVEIGVDFAQGYALAEPRPLDSLRPSPFQRVS